MLGERWREHAWDNCAESRHSAGMLTGSRQAGPRRGVAAPGLMTARPQRQG